MNQKIVTILEESLTLKMTLVQDESLIQTIRQIVERTIEALRNNKKILFCGNGGSAADAQHLAAELSGRFYLDRPPLFAEVLHDNSSFLTAVANDYGYEEVFARGVEAKGQEDDILFALSTSGNSPSIVNAAKIAKKMKISVIGLTGKTGGKLKEHCDLIAKIPSSNTPRIQEGHMLVGHIICELVEEIIFKKNDD